MAWSNHRNRLSTRKYGHTATAINEHQIVVVGGLDDYSNSLKTVEIININNNNINNTSSSYVKSLPDLPNIRYAHKSVLLGDYLYIIGGAKDSSNVLNSAYRINILPNDNETSSKSWEEIAPMNQKRSYFAAVAHQDKIFVFGGVDVDDDEEIICLDSVECYCLVKNSWTPIPTKMEKARCGHSAVLVGDEIFVIGGWDNVNEKILKEVEIFHTKLQTFRKGLPLPIPLCATTAMVIKNQYIIVIGGETTDDKINKKSFLLDTQSNNEWITIDNDLNTGRHNHAGTLMNQDTIVVCGGKDDNRNKLDSFEYISFQGLTGIGK